MRFCVCRPALSRNYHQQLSANSTGGDAPSHRLRESSGRKTSSVGISSVRRRPIGPCCARRLVSQPSSSLGVAPPKWWQSLPQLPTRPGSRPSERGGSAILEGSLPWIGQALSDTNKRSVARCRPASTIRESRIPFWRRHPPFFTTTIAASGSD